MARALRQLGFTVIERHDVTRDQVLKALADFRRTLSNAEVGLFYFAGHGLSIDGANYLVPVKSGFKPMARTMWPCASRPRPASSTPSRSWPT